jgi:hypothetical protein
MRSIVRGLIMMTLIAGTATTAVLACGDKFLVPTRGMRFDLPSGARQEATVLVFARPASSLADIFERLSIERALRNAGYRPAIVASSAEFAGMLQQRSWDVVLIDVTDGPLKDAPQGSPAVLAVAAHGNGNDLARARPQYAAILKSPSRSQTFIVALDAAIATRHAARRNAQGQSR